MILAREAYRVTVKLLSIPDLEKMEPSLFLSLITTQSFHLLLFHLTSETQISLFISEK